MIIKKKLGLKPINIIIMHRNKYISYQDNTTNLLNQLLNVKV